MEVARIAHAGVVVASRTTRVFMDPVLFAHVEAGALALNPGIRVDRSRLRAEPPDLVVISHEHLDHFCVRSLNLLDRGTPVAFPRGAALIEAGLFRLGFTQRLAVEPGKKLTVGDLVLVPTPSRVTFPEMGMLFLHQGRCVWNVADAVINAGVVEFVHRATPRVHVMLAPYQPLIERELSSDALGAGFPYASYGTHVRNVVDARPACVVPGSFGYRSRVERWIDDRRYPVTEAQFLHDVRAVLPTVMTRRLEPGDAVSVARGYPTRRAAVRWLRPVPGSPPRWRPDLGVPSLRDRGRRAKAPDVWRRVSAFLAGQFLVQLGDEQRAALRERLRAGRVLWHLEVVTPTKTHRRALDFATPRLRWRSQRTDDFPQFHTSITASAIDGLITGELSPYAVHYCGMMRRFVRWYQPYHGGVHALGSNELDPLMAVLGVGASERHLDWLLRHLEVSA